MTCGTEKQDMLSVISLLLSGTSGCVMQARGSTVQSRDLCHGLSALVCGALLTRVMSTIVS